MTIRAAKIIPFFELFAICTIFFYLIKQKFYKKHAISCLLTVFVLPFFVL